MIITKKGVAKNISSYEFSIRRGEESASVESREGLVSSSELDHVSSSQQTSRHVKSSQEMSEEFIAESSR